MFEKEADEWVVDSVCKDCSRYEKCKSKESCACKECVKEKRQKGAEFGYNKANEWHFVKDEEKYERENQAFLTGIMIGLIISAVIVMFVL